MSKRLIEVGNEVVAGSTLNQELSKIMFYPHQY